MRGRRAALRTMIPPADFTAPTRPNSPCVNVCVLDGAGFCIGCWRTGAEIALWTGMSAQEQWALIATLAERRRTPGRVR
jgi:predicted Fe-S protein YdhL (DUF1289 family)